MAITLAMLREVHARGDAAWQRERDAELAAWDEVIASNREHGRYIRRKLRGAWWSRRLAVIRRAMRYLQPRQPGFAIENPPRATGIHLDPHPQWHHGVIVTVIDDQLRIVVRAEIVGCSAEDAERQLDMVRAIARTMSAWGPVEVHG